MFQNYKKKKVRKFQKFKNKELKKNCSKKSDNKPQKQLPESGLVLFLRFLRFITVGARVPARTGPDTVAGYSRHRRRRSVVMGRGYARRVTEGQRPRLLIVSGCGCGCGRLVEVASCRGAPSRQLERRSQTVAGLDAPVNFRAWLLLLSADAARSQRMTIHKYFEINHSRIKNGLWVGTF